MQKVSITTLAKEFVINHMTCFVLLIILLLFSVFSSAKINDYYAFVDWKTILALSDLLLITKGLQESKFFDFIAKSIIFRVHEVRKLTILLLFITLLMSMLITNDIALFIIVPLTLAITKHISTNSVKILVFETFAANIGSLLTPFGNPQNIFLFHQWDISPFIFIFKMLLLEAVLIVILLIYALIFTKKNQISINSTFTEHTAINKKLLLLSLSLFALFIIALEFDWLFYISPSVFLIFLILNRVMIKKCNWSLILIFILMFLNVSLFLDITFIGEEFAFLSHSSTFSLYTIGIGLSQLISNVPASIFLVNFSNNWLVIAFSVNIAANGTIISSMANFITLKLSQLRKFLLIFHLYSLPFLLISSIIGYFLLFI